MAKMKQFAVDVEIVIKRTLFVTARRPDGARQRVMSEEGWVEALQYEEPEDLDLMFYRNSAKVVAVREA